MERRFLQQQLEAGRSLEQIGAAVGKHPSTVGYWLKKHGLAAVNSAKYAPRGGLQREQVVALVERGLTTRQIARECAVSESTIQYWLGRYGLRTVRARQAAPSEWPKPRRTSRSCIKHGLTGFILEKRGYYRCARCRSEQVAQRRRKVKEILVREAGGRCVLCGYDRHVGALQFHHLDPHEKSFSISEAGVTRSLARARIEAAKCALVCANCHAMVEAGDARL
jgi:IS30 family transposase